MNNRQMNLQGMKLFQKMFSAKESSPENILFSPYSLFCCLAMAASGAKGQTKQEILTLLGIPDDRFEATIGSLQRSLTNRMKDSIQQFRAAYLNDQLNVKSSWRNTIQDDFTAALYQLDFSDPLSVANLINLHVEEHTRGMLKNVLSPEQISGTCGLILLDTLFFQGKWEFPFEPECTRNKTFFCPDGMKLTAPMMEQQKWFPYFIDSRRKIHGVVLPYKDNDCEMIAVMPTAAQTPLQSVMDALGEGCLEEWLKSASTEQKTKVTLPRMKLKANTTGLVSILKSSGMAAAFTAQADFSGIGDGSPLMLNQIMQSVKIELDECGTKAAAVTLMIAPAGGPPPKSLTINIFRADRPFVVLIRNKTLDTIIFACVIQHPESNAEEEK